MKSKAKICIGLSGTRLVLKITFLLLGPSLTYFHVRLMQWPKIPYYLCLLESRCLKLSNNDVVGRKI